MNMTVLSLIQGFTGEYGLPIPTGVIGSTDKAVVQYRSMLAWVTRRLCGYNLQQQNIRITWTSIAAEDQGALSTLMPGFSSMSPGTLWDETEQWPVFGPLADVSWEALQAFANTGPLYQYKIASDHILVNPAMPSGHTLACTYRTSYGWITAAGVAEASPSADNSTTLFPDDLMLVGLERRWKEIKGEPWADTESDWVGLISSAKMSDGGMPTLSLSGGNQTARPGIYVPAGNWIVP